MRLSQFIKQLQDYHDKHGDPHVFQYTLGGTDPAAVLMPTKLIPITVCAYRNGQMFAYTLDEAATGEDMPGLLID